MTRQAGTAPHSRMPPWHAHCYRSSKLARHELPPRFTEGCRPWVRRVVPECEDSASLLSLSGSLLELLPGPWRSRFEAACRPDSVPVLSVSRSRRSRRRRTRRRSRMTKSRARMRLRMTRCRTLCLRALRSALRRCRAFARGTAHTGCCDDGTRRVEAAAVPCGCECGCPALNMMPMRRAVARAFLSVDSSLSSSNSRRAAYSAQSSTVHSGRRDGWRAARKSAGRRER